MPAHADIHPLDAAESIPADELCRACRITVAELHEFVGYGVLQPVQRDDALVFAADWLMPLREAARLRRAFDLDLFAAGLIAEHLHRIATLEQEIRTLRARMAP